MTARWVKLPEFSPELSSEFFGLYGAGLFHGFAGSEPV